MAAKRQPLKLRAARWTGLAVRAVVRAGWVLLAPAAAAAVSFGAGELAARIFGRGLGPWVTLTLVGLFGLWVAREINTPAAPREEDGEV